MINILFSCAGSIVCLQLKPITTQLVREVVKKAILKDTAFIAKWSIRVDNTETVLLIGNNLCQFHYLTHLSFAPHKNDIGKQCGPRSDTTERRNFYKT